MRTRLAVLGFALAGCPAATGTDPTPDETPEPTPPFPADCPDGYVPDGDLCRIDAPQVPPDWNDPWPADPPPPPICDNPPPANVFDTLFASCTSTLAGDLRITTEAEMTAFCASYDCVAGGIDIGSTEGGGGGGATGIFSLDNLSCLKAARYLWVGANQDLVGADLPNLLGLTGALTFANNPALQTIDLPAFEVVGGDLSIQQNRVLTGLDLPALLAVYEFMFIVGNDILPTSSAEAIRDRLCRESVGGAIAIAGNGEG